MWRKCTRNLLTDPFDNSVNLVLASGSGQLCIERSCPCGAPWPHYPPRESGSQRKERGMGEREESVTRSAVSGRPCRRHLGHWHRALSTLQWPVPGVRRGQWLGHTCGHWDMSRERQNWSGPCPATRSPQAVKCLISSNGLTHCLTQDKGKRFTFSITLLISNHLKLIYRYLRFL